MYVLLGSHNPSMILVLHNLLPFLPGTALVHNVLGLYSNSTMNQQSITLFLLHSFLPIPFHTLCCDVGIYKPQFVESKLVFEAFKISLLTTVSID